MEGPATEQEEGVRPEEAAAASGSAVAVDPAAEPATTASGSDPEAADPAATTTTTASGPKEEEILDNASSLFSLPQSSNGNAEGQGQCQGPPMEVSIGGKIFDVYVVERDPVSRGGGRRTRKQKKGVKKMRKTRAKKLFKKKKNGGGKKKGKTAHKSKPPKKRTTKKNTGKK